MNPETFAEWLRRRNYTVVRTESSYWHLQSFRAFQAFPYQWCIAPAEAEIKDLLRRTGGVVARYSIVPYARVGMPSYHVVYTDKHYTFEMLPKKARHDVKKGLEYTRIEMISCDQLATEGWELRLETLVRQRRQKAETQRWWRDLCLSAANLGGFEAWGAFHNGRLVASLLAFLCDDCYSILYQQSLTEHMSFGINNALTFTVTRHALQRTEVGCIFYGLASLDAPESVDQFKFRMNYCRKPVRQMGMFHPLISPFVNPILSGAVARLSGWLPGSIALSKANGLIQLHRGGSGR